MLLAPGSVKTARRVGSRNLSRSIHASSHFAEVSFRQTSIGRDCGDFFLMSNEAEAEAIKHQPEVQRALKQAQHSELPEASPKTEDKLWLGTHALLLVGLAALYYILGLEWISNGFAKAYIPLLQRLTRGATLIVLVLAAAKIVDVYLISGLGSAVGRYNLRRMDK